MDELLRYRLYNEAVETDRRLRRHIRMCYWKQWRRTKKRICELIKNGDPRYHAILTGLRRQGYWHLSRTLSTNCGLSNAHLETQGLVSYSDAVDWYSLSG